MSLKLEGEPKEKSREAYLQSLRFIIPDFRNYQIAAMFVDKYHQIYPGSQGFPVDLYSSSSQEGYFKRVVNNRYGKYRNSNEWLVNLEILPRTSLVRYRASLIPLATQEEAARVQIELAKKQQQYRDTVRLNQFQTVDRKALLDEKFRSDSLVLVPHLSLEQPNQIVSSLQTACRVFQVHPPSNRKIALRLELGANTISRTSEQDFLVILARNKLWEITLEKERDDVYLGVRAIPNRSDLQYAARVGHW